MRWRGILECAVLLGLLICASPIEAQSVSQSGSVTPGHAACWTTTGVIKDCGSATTGVITSLGVTASGPALCQQSAATGAFNRICLSATATAGGIAMTNIGGATGGFTFTLNGVTQGMGTVTLPVTSGDLACFSDSSGTLRDCGTTPVTNSAVSGTASAIILTTGLGLTSLTNGQEFIFTPTGTVAGALPTIVVDSVAAKNVKSVDGYSFSVYYNIQAGKPLRVRYLSSLDVFTILSPPTQFEDTPFGHGTAKLQAASATSLSISQEDGQGMLMWNSATSALRMVRLDSITTAGNLFSGNTTYVNGAANQNALPNKLYSIYVNNTDPTNQNATRLELWETYSGVGVAAWGPIIGDLGVYFKPTTAGGAIADNTRTYVGIIWTGASDISNKIASAASMGNFVYSHFAKNRWKFGYKTTLVSNAIASATLTTQTTPAVLSVSEAISDSPRYDAKANATCDTAGAVVSFRISISGTSFNGAAFTDTSNTSTGGVPSANIPVHLTATWESAPPMGVYTAQTDIAVDIGSCTFATQIIGHLSQ